MVAAGGALLRLPRSMPYNVAMELALTGEPMLAERAYELGLVNRLAEPGAAAAVALGLARQIAASAPLALIASKRILRAQPDWPARDVGSAERDRRPGVRLGGRPRGRKGFRREASAGVARQVVAASDRELYACDVRLRWCKIAMKRRHRL